MKKVIVSLCMLATLSFAMETGTKSLGGSGTVTLGDPMTMNINANVGYFAMDNIEASVGFGLADDGSGADMVISYAFGGNYYMGNMYGGGKYSGTTVEGSKGALDFRGGYLMGLGEGSTFLNLYGNYNMSLAEGVDGVLSVGFGIVTFF